MNLIDHRILIPTSPERVWHFVGDLKRNTEWQVNCRAVSMLTSTPKPQAGTRLRITPDRGREYVIELTAWYDRLGYEYIIVEGANFRDNKGTVRLQEVPEGTIVQWTFSYKPGLFGGGARGQEGIIVDSLRGLYKLITKSREVETFQAKSLIREDPGVEARATYRPRHPYGDTAEGSAVKKGTTRPQPAASPPPVTFTEPPIKPDDTKPRPIGTISTPEPAVSPPAVVIPPVPQVMNSLTVEPDFLIDDDVPFADVPSEPVVPLFSRPPVEPDPPVVAPPLPQVQPVAEPPTLPPDPVTPEAPPTVTPAPAAPVAAAAMTPASPAAPERQDTAPIATPYPTPAEVMPAVRPTPSPRPDKLMDTSRISVFELFGLPKPSETQEITPLRVDEKGDPIAATASAEAVDLPAPASVSTPVAASEARRHGHRALMRQKIVRLRRP